MSDADKQQHIADEEWIAAYGPFEEQHEYSNVAVERSGCRDPKTLACISAHPFCYAAPSFVMQI